jgi:hypothetical protein
MMSQIGLYCRLFGAKQAGQEKKFQSLVYKYLEITKQLLIGDIVPSLKWLSYVSGSVAAMKKVVSDCDKHLQTHLDEKRRAIVSETHQTTVDAVGNCDDKSQQQGLVDVLMQQPAVDGNGKLDDTSIACLVRVSNTCPSTHNHNNHTNHFHTIFVNLRLSLVSN